MANSARKIEITNPSISQVEQLILSQDYTSGTTLYVDSNETSATVLANKILLLEGYGSEKSELGIVSTTTSTSQIGLSSALNFTHTKGSTIYLLEFDQAEVSYYNGTAWAVLDTIAIQPDKKDTLYIHSGGTSDYSYRFRFKNSASGDFSEYSPTLGGGGYTNNQIGYVVKKVQQALKDSNEKIMTIEEIIDWVVESKNIIKARRSDWWFWQKEDKGTITTIADTRKYNLDDISTKIEYIRDVRFRDESTDDYLYPIERLPDYLFDRLVIDQDEDPDDHVQKYRLLPADSSSTSGYIEVDPIPENTGNGSFYIRYYEPDSDYEDMSDLIYVPLPIILTYLPIAEGLKKKGDYVNAKRYESMFNGPGDSRKDNEPLTGISLLEKMQIDKLKPTASPKYLKRYIGRAGVSGLYGSREINRDSIAEDYFDYPIR